MIVFLFYVLCFWPGGSWGLGSPTRSQTCTPCLGRGSLSHCTPREVSVFTFDVTLIPPYALYLTYCVSVMHGNRKAGRSTNVHINVGCGEFCHRAARWQGAWHRYSAPMSGAVHTKPRILNQTKTCHSACAHWPNPLCRRTPYCILKYLSILLDQKLPTRKGWMLHYLNFPCSIEHTIFLAYSRCLVNLMVIYTTLSLCDEYYSAIKKDEIMPFAATWMDIEMIMLNEICEKKRDKYHMISLICRIYNNDIHVLIYKPEVNSQT